MMKYYNSPDAYLKPLYSYNALTMMAIMDSPRGMLTFPEICEYVQAKFPYYQKNINDGWQKALRSQLLSGKFFVLVPGQQNIRKGAWDQYLTRYWMLNPKCPELCLSTSTGRVLTKRRNRSNSSRKDKEANSMKVMQQFPSRNLDLEEFGNLGFDYAPKQVSASLEPATESNSNRAYQRKEIFSVNKNSLILNCDNSSENSQGQCTPRSPPVVASTAQGDISMGGIQFQPFPFHHETGLTDPGLQVKEIFSINGDCLEDLQAVLEVQPDYI